MKVMRQKSRSEEYDQINPPSIYMFPLLYTAFILVFRGL